MITQIWRYNNLPTQWSKRVPVPSVRFLRFSSLPKILLLVIRKLLSLILHSYKVSILTLAGCRSDPLSSLAGCKSNSLPSMMAGCKSNSLHSLAERKSNPLLSSTSTWILIGRLQIKFSSITGWLHIKSCTLIDRYIYISISFFSIKALFLTCVNNFFKSARIN